MTPITWPLAVTATLAMIGWGLALIQLLAGDRYRIGERITRLEVHREDDDRRAERIERKIDELLRAQAQQQQKETV
jgi:hypothetical protein